jgi:antitoxin (DNA-binding transcriptional repressor) of toxin-antitoxin stability system
MATKVDIQEFRERLAEFLEATTPVEVTRDGKTVGIFTPCRRPHWEPPTEADRKALREAAAQVRADLEAAGITEEEFVREFEEERRRARASRRKAS